jgi:hypothetical protein
LITQFISDEEQNDLPQQLQQLLAIWKKQPWLQNGQNCQGGTIKEGVALKNDHIPYARARVKR